MILHGSKPEFLLCMNMQHKMKEEQGQCVEMEGTAEKASTSPTDSSEYGKLLDQVCMRSSHERKRHHHTNCASRQ